jgi:hypothetical protein
MHFADTFHDSCAQQPAEGHDMHGCQGVDELLIIAGQAMASLRPDTTPLHLKVQGFRLSLLRRVLPRLRLVDRGDLPGIVRGILDLCSQRIDRLMAHRAVAVCGLINLHAFGGPDSPVDEKSGGTLPVLAILCSGPNTICTKARSQILPKRYY